MTISATDTVAATLNALDARMAALEASTGVSLPTLAFANAVTQAEGNSGTTVFSFTLNLTRNGSTAAIPFTWSVVGSGANPASAADFLGNVLPSGSGTFAAGETSKTISINVAAESSVEPDEGFSLTAAASLPLVVAQAAGEITNDDAPVLAALTLSALSYPENIAPGTIVAAINGGEAGSTVTLISDAGGRIAKSSANLTAGLVNTDYEATPTVSVTLRQAKAGFADRDQVFSLSVTDVAETAPDVTAPTITSATALNQIENAAFSLTLTANEAVTFTKGATFDSAQFTLNGNTLTLPAKNFEAPTDSDTNNSYVCALVATDTAGNATSFNVTVTITDADEIAPTITSGSAFSQAENSAFSTTLTASEPVTWVKAGGADAALFTLSGATLSMAARDYEAPGDADTNNTYVVQVRATDTALNVSAIQTVTVTITDITEGGTVNSINGFGSSSVAGNGTSSAPKSMLNMIGAAVGATTIRNNGQGGTVFQASPGASGSPLSSNGYGRYVSQLLGANISDRYYMLWPNDLRYTGNPSQFNVAGYTRDFRAMLSNLIIQGIDPTSIYLGSPTWYDISHYSIGSTGYTGSDDATNQSYGAATLALAQEFGTRFADIYSAIRDNGGLSLFVASDVHWKDGGHQVAANTFLAAGVANIAQKPSSLAGTSTVGGRVDYTWSAVPSAVSYELQVGTEGSLSFGLASATPIGTSAQISGLTGNIRARIRAIFSDGTKSPWAFAASPTTVFVDNTISSASVPTISGTAQQGQVLTGSNGTWNGSPTSYAYQWRRSGTAISGATAATYTLVAGDVGATITLLVTATNAAGNSASASSTPTPTVVATPMAAPTNSAVPVISGTAQDGQTLTASNGTWNNGPTSYAYQWKRGATNVGTNSANYVLVTADVGATITCTVTATNTAGSASATSGATATVVAAAAGGVQFFNDTFTAADETALVGHVSDSGHNWSNISGAGTPKVNAGHIYNALSVGSYRALAAPPSADYFVDAIYDYMGTVAGSENSGICIRADASANTYYWVRFNSAGWSLFKTVAGTSTQLGATYADTFPSGSRTVRLRAQGSTISVSLDGGATTIVSVTDTAITAAGYPGIRPISLPAGAGHQVSSITATSI